MKAGKTQRLVFIFAGGILMSLISFTIIFQSLIPDPCYYHFNEMNSFMNLFYSAGPADNGHPGPNLLNFIVSFSVGGILGFGVYKIMENRNCCPSNNKGIK